jgi:two-component system, LytTR family, response regulator
MKAVIIEDEPKGIENLRFLLSRYCPDVEIIATAETVADASAFFQTAIVPPDVAFLDISLPDGLIFQALNELPNIGFEIIFVTAYRDFAVKAFDYGAVGYIVKPIDADALQLAVQRARMARGQRMPERIDIAKQHYPTPNAFGKLSISAIDGIHFVAIRDIVRLQGDDNYTHIFTNKGEKMTVTKTIKHYDELLSTLNFHRVHKSHLINLNFMLKFIRSESKVVMSDGTAIEVSRRRRPPFLDLLNGTPIE